MAENEVVITVKGKDETKSATDSAKHNLNGLKSALGDVTKIASGFVLGAGIEKAAGFFASSAKAAADDAASVAKLQQAVKNSGATWDAYKVQMDGVIERGMKLGFTDDQTRDSLALLVAQTGSAEEATKRYAMAQDLARGANIDVTTASKLLGKVTEENANVLGRYGITVKKGASETELFGAIQQKFGGQAEAFGKSTAGQMARLKIQMGELKEQIGYALLPVLNAVATVAATKVAPAIAKVLGTTQTFINTIKAGLQGDVAKAASGFAALPPPLQALALWLAKNQDEIKAFASVVRNLASDVLEGWKRILVELGPPLLKLAEYIGRHKPLLIALAIAFGVALAVLIGIPVIIAGVIVAVGLLAAHWDSIKKKTLDVWNSIPGPIKDAIAVIVATVKMQFELIKSEIETALEIIRGVIKTAVAIWHGDWSEAWEGIKQVAMAIWDGIVRDITIRLGSIRDIFAFGGSAIGGAWKAIWDGLKDTARDALNWIIGKVNDLINKINGVGGALSKIGIDAPDIPGIPTIPGAATPGTNAGGGGDNTAPFPFASGTPFVPRNMVALLHRGERVVPAAENAIGGGGSGVEVNITVQASHDIGSIVAAVSRKLEVELRTAGFGGSYTTSGAYTPS